MKTDLFFKLVLTFAVVMAAVAPQSAEAQGVDVIVLDPGHGGKFPGASYRGVTEKSLTLKVALKLGALIEKNHPEIKVVYTRTTDIALSSVLSVDLGTRSKIAREAEGDLFVSIHVNAAASTAAYGVETIIMGESSLEKTRNDAALYAANEEALIDMSDEKTAAIVRAYIQNLQFTYGQYSELLARLIQKSYGDYGRKLRGLRRQPLMVLYGTDMPCVLTEIGFLSNSSEFAYLTSTKGQDEVALSIYGGINEYIKTVNRTSKSADSTVEEEQPKEQPVKQESSEELKSGYTIQILSSKVALATNDRQFRGYAGQQWLNLGSGRYKYKYCIGRYPSKAAALGALSSVRASFKDAFVIPFENK